jgi:GNAT superfamily N-acetyltransferase
MQSAIQVMRSAAKWLVDTGKKPSKWWQLKNLNSDFLLQYAKPEEFYVALLNEKPVTAAVLQINQNSQDWSSIDKNKPKPALYIHWLCVDNQFSGKGLSKAMIDFAEKKAKRNNLKILRVDTNAEEMKLRAVYERLGFSLVGVEKEDYRDTAFYEKKI